jgi:hypothetical protein
MKTMFMKFFLKKKENKPILNNWSYKFLSKMSNLKFISYIGDDGFPVILPVIQAQALTENKIIFHIDPNHYEFSEIHKGSNVALFCMSTDMEDILIRGTYMGINKILGMNYAVVEINWVYNPMPPVAGQIYPEIDIKPVEVF